MVKVLLYTVQLIILCRNNLPLLSVFCLLNILVDCLYRLSRFELVNDIYTQLCIVMNILFVKVELSLKQNNFTSLLNTIESIIPLTN